MDSVSIKSRAIKGVSWSALQIWGSRAIGFLVFVVLSRLLDPKAFGLLALASIFVAFVQIFVDQGMADAIVQRVNLDTKHLDTAFWIGIIMGGLLTIAGNIASSLIAKLFNEPLLTPIVQWLSFGFLFAALSSTQQAILRRELAFKQLAMRSLIASAVGGTVGVVMAFLGFGVWSLVGQSLANGFAGAVILWKVSNWRPGFGFSWTHFKELIGFGFNIVGSQILNLLNRRSDDFLIGYFLGPIALGYYTIAYRIFTEMTLLLTSVTSAVAFPVFSRLQAEPEKMRDAFYKVTQFTNLVAFPAFLGMSIVAPELITVIFGTKWAPSIPVMQVLAFIGILHSTLYFADNVILAAGKPSWALGITMLNAVSNVVAFIIAVRWGIVAVAVAYVIRGYILSPIPLWAIQRLIGINITTYLHQAVVPLIGSLLMAATIFIIRYFLDVPSPLYLRLAIYVLIGVLTYLLSIKFLDPSLSQKINKLLHTVFPGWGTGLEKN